MRPFLFFSCLMLALPLAAKDFTVATVDLQKLFKEYPGTQEAEAKLSKVAERKMKDLKESAQEVGDLKKELETSGSLLSAKTKERKEGEYKDKYQKLMLLQEKVQNDLKAQEVEMTQQVLKEIKALAAQVAKEKGCDLLLDSEKTVFVKGELDLTEELLKKFEKMGGTSKSKK